eukprot:TRINITY_DN11301_c2_g1_i1.p1 TRINITY_DN11301_c2_g1~~TRINITY_DN11301_c2_g1_i1.p1  ORF type:complete len:523 (+),score=82.85 TRINITY_DN11301_c2_g1_i1:38-1606(+)
MQPLRSSRRWFVHSLSSSTNAVDAVLLRDRSTCEAAFARRWRSSGKSRFNMIRQRAVQQHVDYLRQLDAPRPYRSVEVESKLQSPAQDVKTTFTYPEITRQPTEDELAAQDRKLRAVDAFSASTAFEGRIGGVDLEPFGTIEVIHGDIFDFKEADALILPMSRNLVPYRGLALEAFDRGGRKIVKETFDAWHRAQKKTDYEHEGINSTEGLESGDTVLVNGCNIADQSVLFTIMPWFWEGSPMDAGKRLRSCVRYAFLAASGHRHDTEEKFQWVSLPSVNSGPDGRRWLEEVHKTFIGPSLIEEQSAFVNDGFTSIALPNLGAGVFGYEPQDSCRTIVEEAVEALLQVEASNPRYTLKKISFVESNKERAYAFHDALTEVAHRWLPDRKVTTAAQWWGLKSRRLIVLPDAPNFFWKRHRVKFKKRHGVPKRARHDYIGNVKPWLWRAHRVQQPPPLLVFKQSGEIAPRDVQLKARPYYFRGVSHWLFPSRRGGFHNMRRSARGQWVGVLQQYKIREDVRPRL